MKVVKPSWDFAKKHHITTRTYIQCIIQDEALGLWVLHFKDSPTIIKRKNKAPIMMMI